MATLSFLVGPVGAGKSTLARQRAARSPSLFLDVDTWMVRLYGGDARPAANVVAWYVERRERVRELIWTVAADALAAGVSVQLELGLVTAAEREAWFARAVDVDVEITVVDAPRDVRRERVARRNLSASSDVQRVPPAFFEAASDAWQPISDDERARWRVVDA